MCDLGGGGEGGTHTHAHAHAHAHTYDCARAHTRHMTHSLTTADGWRQELAAAAADQRVRVPKRAAPPPDPPAFPFNSKRVRAGPAGLLHEAGTVGRLREVWEGADEHDAPSEHVGPSSGRAGEEVGEGGEGGAGGGGARGGEDDGREGGRSQRGLTGDRLGGEDEGGEGEGSGVDEEWGGEWEDASSKF